MDEDDLRAVLGHNLFPALTVSRAAAPGPARAGRRRDRDDRLRVGPRGGRRAELQHREGGGDQPREGDGARPRDRTGSASSASRPAPRSSPEAAGSAGCGRIRRRWPHSSSGSCPGAASARCPRSATSSPSSLAAGLLGRSMGRGTRLSSLAAALAIRDATWVSSGGSGFGAPAKAGATIGHERQPAGHAATEADSRTVSATCSTLSRNRVRHNRWSPPRVDPRTWAVRRRRRTGRALRHDHDVHDERRDDARPAR